MLRSFALALCTLATCPSFAGEWSCLQGDAESVRVLSFKGGIERGELGRFGAAFVACYPSSFRGQRIIDLDSHGGSVKEALDISKAVVREGSGGRPVATQVRPNAVCISACTYLFVAGRLRNVRTGGSFEPHGFSSFGGMRIDDAIRKAKAQDGSIQLGELERNLQFSRLLTLAEWMPMLARGDERFAFASNLFVELADRQNAPRAALPRLAQRFEELPVPQRAFVQDVDAIIATAFPELERVAALKGFERVLAAAGGAAPPLDERRYFEWVVGELGLAINAYLRATKESRSAKLSEELLATMLNTQRERVRSVASTVQEDLLPYLESRADQIDVAGLVRLMFSVSILYTRPVTREEMCDLNVINRDCGN
jgi:hypothetical protein